MARLTRRALLGGVASAGPGAAVVAGAATRPRTREYWVAAVPEWWDMVPNGRDGIGRRSFPEADRTFNAVVYREFSPGFKSMLPRATPQLDGLLGPRIRARVGDEIHVHFLNLDREREHSMHFHGVQYAVGSDGAYIPGFSGKGARVKPGERFTYRLKAGRDSAGVWPYHDHSTSMHESLAGGLYGSMSIAGRDERRADRENVVFFAHHNGFMTINGRAFVGNTPVFHARVGDLVQWNVLTLGEEFHTFHIHGHRWRRADGTPEDTRTLGPAESFRVRFREDAPGAWLYHCHVESHMVAGMMGLYRVRR